MGKFVGSVNEATRYGSLLRLALPSILLQSGAPLAITVQTALLGRKATELVAAWAIVATATNAATVVFNFLVVGVTAKVSKVVGAKAWSMVGSRIRLALLSALIMGFVAAGLLAAIKPWLFILLEDTPEARGPAEAYFYLRVIGVPPQLLAMCTSGILQGYKRVYLVASIQVFRLAIDVAASYVALYVFDFGIRGVGIGNLLASSVSAIIAFTFILLLPPEEGRSKIYVLRPPPERHTGVGQYEWNEAKVPLLPSLGQEGEAAVNGTGLGNGYADGEHKPQPTLYGQNQVYAVEAEDEDEDVSALEEGTWKFVWDGLSTMLRSALVQLSFFLVLASVTALGVHAVAAHQVVMQLWMITVYIADGFATAGTIVGSEFAGKIDNAHSLAGREAAVVDLRRVCSRVLLMGTTAGCVIGLIYWMLEGHIMALFTTDPLTKAQLSQVWQVLVIVQPLNAIVFVYDGFIYAAQAFSYMANCLTVGFIFIFLPVIGAARFHFKTLLSAWAAKIALNIVRLVVASYKIHFDFLCPPPYPEHLHQVITPTEAPITTEALITTEPLELAVDISPEGSRDQENDVSYR